jgi:hypothetical protein
MLEDIHENLLTRDGGIGLIIITSGHKRATHSRPSLYCFAISNYTLYITQLPYVFNL